MTNKELTEEEKRQCDIVASWLVRSPEETAKLFNIGSYILDSRNTFG